MDSSFVIKPRTAYVPRDPVRVRETVATELDGAKAVAAPGDGGGRPGDQRHDHPSFQDLSHHDHVRQDHVPHDHPPRVHPHDPSAHDHAPQEVVVDADSLDLIYRERDVRAAEREHPDQALLRQRAYRPAPVESESAGLDIEPHADVKA
jgi:hypothetical protein